MKKSYVKENQNLDLQCDPVDQFQLENTSGGETN